MVATRTSKTVTSVTEFIYRYHILANIGHNNLTLNTLRAQRLSNSTTHCRTVSDYLMRGISTRISFGGHPHSAREL